MSDSVLAIIPAYNEADLIRDVVTRTRPYVAAVVVVDDGSADDTAQQAQAAGATVLRHEQNQGKGGAIITALRHFGESDHLYAVFLDADGQHDPAEIPKFVEAARANDAGIVVGTRMATTREMPRMRRGANAFTSWLTSRLARARIPDSQCGYRLLARKILGDLKLASRHFETETEMLIQAGRAGHRIVSVPIRTIYLKEARASHIRPLRDTVRFFRLVGRYWR